MRLKRQRFDFPRGPAGFLKLGARRDGVDPVVLVHGFAGDLLTWQYTLAHLAHRGEVIAIDLPGHGGSTQDVGDGRVAGLAAWLWDALDAMGVGRCALVGHSMGGNICLLAAMERPERVSGLALLSCAGVGPAVDVDMLRRSLSARTIAEAEASVATLFAGPSAMVPAMGRALLGRLTGPVPVTPLWTILETSFGPERRWEPVDWAALPVPPLVIWGDSDRLVPLPAAEHLPTEHVHLLPGVGHMPQWEAPTAVNHLLESHLLPDG